MSACSAPLRRLDPGTALRRLDLAARVPSVGSVLGKRLGQSAAPPSRRSVLRIGRMESADPSDHRRARAPVPRPALPDPVPRRRRARFTAITSSSLPMAVRRSTRATCCSGARHATAVRRRRRSGEGGGGGSRPDEGGVYRSTGPSLESGPTRQLYSAGPERENSPRSGASTCDAGASDGIRRRGMATAGARGPASRTLSTATARSFELLVETLATERKARGAGRPRGHHGRNRRAVGSKPHPAVRTMEAPGRRQRRCCGCSDWSRQADNRRQFDEPKQPKGIAMARRSQVRPAATISAAAAAVPDRRAAPTGALDMLPVVPDPTGRGERAWNILRRLPITEGEHAGKRIGDTCAAVDAALHEADLRPYRRSRLAGVARSFRQHR